MEYFLINKHNEKITLKIKSVNNYFEIEKTIKDKFNVTYYWTIITTKNRKDITLEELEEKFIKEGFKKVL